MCNLEELYSRQQCISPTWDVVGTITDRQCYSLNEKYITYRYKKQICFTLMFCFTKSTTWAFCSGVTRQQITDWHRKISKFIERKINFTVLLFPKISVRIFSSAYGQVPEISTYIISNPWLLNLAVDYQRELSLNRYFLVKIRTCVTLTLSSLSCGLPILGWRWSVPLAVLILPPFSAPKTNISGLLLFTAVLLLWCCADLGGWEYVSISNGF